VKNPSKKFNGHMAAAAPSKNSLAANGTAMRQHNNQMAQKPPAPAPVFQPKVLSAEDMIMTEEDLIMGNPMENQVPLKLASPARTNTFKPPAFQSAAPPPLPQFQQLQTHQQGFRPQNTPTYNTNQQAQQGAQQPVNEFVKWNPNNGW